MLLVDDSRVARAVVGEVLRNAGFEVLEAGDGRAALAQLDALPVEVVVTDLRMPGVHGLGVLSEVRRRDLASEVIILTGAHANDVHCAVQALRLGAHDFIAKPLWSGAQLVLSVEAAVRKLRLRDADRRRIAELTELARRDPLTGAYNRRGFEEACDLELTRARRHGLPLSLCLVDLDHFKDVNDRNGHTCGDAVLCGFTSLCATVLRREDALFRYGGEEFVVLLPNTGPLPAQRAAQRLVRAVRATPIAWGALSVALTCSIGVASRETAHDDRRSLLARADQALYEAKRGGRDAVRSVFLKHRSSKPDG